METPQNENPKGASQTPSISPPISDPAWFPDPLGTPTERFWSGTAWTNETRPIGSITPTPNPSFRVPSMPKPLFKPPSNRQRAAALRAVEVAGDKPGRPKRSRKRKLVILLGSLLAFFVFVGLVAEDPKPKSKPSVASTTIAPPTVTSQNPTVTTALPPKTSIDTTPKATEPPATIAADTPAQTVPVPAEVVARPLTGTELRTFKRDAFEVCKRIVKSNLKSPGTAKFRNVNEDDGEVLITNFTEPDQWDVNSTVDSQNGFGATVRTRWSCSLNYLGGKFSFVNFEFIE